MPGMVTQRAPQQEQHREAPKRSAGEEKKRGLMMRLYDLPRAAGIVVMAVLLVISLFVGNARILARVSPGDFMRRGDVASIVEDRLHAAGNALTVAGRADVSEALLKDARIAIADMESAQTAQEISRADQRLTSAVSEMVEAASGELTGEDLTMLTRAADSFAEQGSFLRQEARSYNEQAKKADALYQTLPARFALSEPDVYEGI